MPLDHFRPEVDEIFEDKQTGTIGHLVIATLKHNIAAGGLRITHDLTQNEVRRLAQIMDLKFRVHGLPVSGGKCGLKIPVGLSDLERKDLIKRFALHFKKYFQNIFLTGKDLGSTEKDVQSIHDALGVHRLVQTKRTLANTSFRSPILYIPDLIIAHCSPEYDDVGQEMTSLGLRTTLQSFLNEIRRTKGQSVLSAAIQGSGQIGTEIKKHLEAEKVEIKLIEDLEHKHSPPWYEAKVDLLIPAACADAIDEKIAEKIVATHIFEAGNITITENAYETLFKKGICVAPDFLINSGMSVGFGLMVANKTSSLIPLFAKKDTMKLMKSRLEYFMSMSKEENISLRELALRTL